MITVAVASPMIPPEWIAAHGVQPRCVPAPMKMASEAAGRRGVCPYAGAVTEVSGGIVLATTCDQMRYAASVLEQRGDAHVFLMNITSTWQTPAARSLYIDELHRLSRFLVRIGGRPPAAEDLAETMLRFERARARLLHVRGAVSAREFAAALVTVRERSDVEVRPERPREGVSLALIGGPLPQADYEVLDWIEDAGGRIVLDASEWGERTLPRPFDPQRRLASPLDELADAYFGSIPDVFRRPNDPCFDYLGRELAVRQVRGVVFRRYLSCDLWHAELPRLKAVSGVPVLDLDVAQSETSAQGRTRGRIEAFLEMFRESGQGAKSWDSGGGCPA